MGTLKLSFPASLESCDRTHIQLDIFSLDAWHLALQHHLYNCRPSPARRAKRRYAVNDPNNLLAPEPWIWDTSDWASDNSLEDDPLDPTPLTTDEVTLLRRADGADDGALQERIKTYELLTGKAKATPDRAYTGIYAADFHEMARREVREKRASNRQKRAERSVKYTSNNNPRGWGFLREILVKNMSDSDVASLIPWDPRQKAYLLTMEETRRGTWIAKAENLDTCTRTKLRRLMEKVAARGWRDVVWVTYDSDDEYSDNDVPLEMEKSEFARAKVMQWEPKTAPRETRSS